MDNRAIAFFKTQDMEDKIMIMDESTASAQDAAKAIGVEIGKIAKSLTFRTNGRPALVVLSGDAKIDSKKFRKTFKVKSKMLEYDEATRLTGYPIGGICPFNLLTDDIDVFLDESLKRNDIVYPGCGDKKALVEVTLKQLEAFSNAKGWVDIGKEWK